MTAAAGMVTHTAAQIILVESVALGCDVWATGDGKSVRPSGEMSKGHLEKLLLDADRVRLWRERP